MSNTSKFLCLVALCALVFFIYNSIGLLRIYSRSATTKGVVVSIVSPNPETAKARNSKWATVAYQVDGKRYVSENRVQIPMALQIGDSVSVRYDTAQPSHLYSYSLTRSALSLVVLLLCAAVVFLQG